MGSVLVSLLYELSPQTFGDNSVIALPDVRIGTGRPEKSGIATS